MCQVDIKRSEEGRCPGAYVVIVYTHKIHHLICVYIKIQMYMHISYVYRSNIYILELMSTSYDPVLNN